VRGEILAVGEKRGEGAQLQGLRFLCLAGVPAMREGGGDRRMYVACDPFDLAEGHRVNCVWPAVSAGIVA